MNQLASYITWKIVCGSPEEAEALERWVSSRIDLDRTIVDTVRATPKGVEDVRAVPYRLGDYFAAIRVLRDGASDPQCLRLGFERRADAGRFWKDLMVTILEEIEASPQKPAIVLDSKPEPDEALARE